MEEKRPDKRWLVKAGRASGIGFALVAFTFIGLGAGLFVDKKFGTSPLFTLALFLLGIVSGFIYIFREVSGK